MLVLKKAGWIITGLAAMAISLSSVAQAAPQQDDLCGNLKVIAENAMQSRQEGTPKAQLTRSIQSPRFPAYWQDAMKSVIDKAYEQPRYQDKNKQQQAVRKYGEVVQKTCNKQS